MCALPAGESSPEAVTETGGQSEAGLDAAEDPRAETRKTVPPLKPLAPV